MIREDYAKRKLSCTVGGLSGKVHRNGQGFLHQGEASNRDVDVIRIRPIEHLLGGVPFRKETPEFIGKR